MSRERQPASRGRFTAACTAALAVAIAAAFAGQPARAAAPTAQLGAWSYVADPLDAGVRDGWVAHPPAMAPVTLPDVANPSPLTGAAGERAYRGAIGWWRTTLTVGAAGRYVVRFGSVHHRATVWIDGRVACEHDGAYEPFECPATLEPGAHPVVVRANWRLPERQQRQGYDRAWFNWGGIAWPVTAAQVNDTEITLTNVQTELGPRRSARVSLTAELRDTRTSGAARPVTVTGALARGADALTVAFAPVTLAAGERRRVTTRLLVTRPVLWSPSRPARYDLALTTGSTTLRRKVGLRELRRSGRRLLLNGRALRIAGAGMPMDAKGRGDALTAADQDRIVDELRAIGANATRSQHPLSDEMLDRLDAAGILVWQHIGPFDKAGRFWARTPRRRATAMARAVATAERTAAHPSVLAFNLANEVAGRGHPKGQARYIDTLARALHRRVPGIFVVADVWGRHPPRSAGGRLFRNLDAVGLTEYIGIFEAAGAPVAELEARVAKLLRRAHAALPGKPLVITEFGANANRRNPTDRPGGYRYQSRLLTRRIGYYARQKGVAGTLIWVLREYAVTPNFRGGTLRAQVPGIELSGPLNEKGLFRFDGSAKPAVAAVAAAYARVARPAPASGRIPAALCRQPRRCAAARAATFAAGLRQPPLPSSPNAQKCLTISQLRSLNCPVPSRTRTVSRPGPQSIVPLP